MPRNFVTERFVPVVTTLLTVLAGYSSWKLGRVELELKKRADQREDRKQATELNLKIYEAVKAALVSQKDAARQQEVARALVVEMTAGEFRTGLLAVLKNSSETAPEVRNAAAFDYESAELTQEAIGATTATLPPSSPLGAWRVDLFWCEASGKRSREQAWVAVSSKTVGRPGRWRVRMLPKTVNERAGYGITAYQIRMNVGEEQAAQALKAHLEGILGVSFVVAQSAQRTPNYLSAFICPNALPSDEANRDPDLTTS